MPQMRPSTSLLLSLALVVVVLPCFTHAFGAGNIGQTSRIEGQNWRHGDIEDTLLTLLMSRAAGGKKFKDLDVKRVYFGNWLRDYSQAVDVGTVKSVSAEAIRIILWVLGFLSFGYGTKEFEVTRDRLGCYRPEEHIDNPKDYADNIDARQYDRRLRGPVDERRELSIDPRTGLKMYIASEDAGITTSAGLVRRLFDHAIQLGRSYARTGNQDEWYEALRLLGTGCHCLEDFPAHSNYTELALRNCGEPDIFPHVGRATGMRIQGGPDHPIFPIVTGTFGGVDFFHSVMGELSDKTTQSEIQELEGSVAQSQRAANKSIVQELLSSLPSGLIGGDKSGKADELEANATAQQMKNARISPRQPEAWTQYLNETIEGMRPILEFHDEIMQSITETIEKIPILPDLLDKLQDQINIFVFSLLAPYVLPVISQVKAELATGSSEVIASSRDKQHIVFRDDHSSDPTHSMLSKDHFSNVLNEPAGKVASQILKWVVPQIIQCMDNESEDVDRTLTRIINGVFHHPAMRNQGYDGAQQGRQLMFSVVENWWREKSPQEKQQLKRQLSREGVESGRNHKEGVHDNGHGCGKPLGMPTMKTAKNSGAIGGPSINTVLSGLGVGAPGGGAGRRPSNHNQNQHGGGGFESQIEHSASQAVGGGILGSMVGGVIGSVFGDNDNDDAQSQGRGGHGPQGRGGRGGFPAGQRGGRGGRGGPGRPASPQRPHSPGKQHSQYGQTSQYVSTTQQSYYDGVGTDTVKSEKKARKKAEKERKKAEKRARKAQGYGSGDSEDSNEDDSDDSDTSRKSGRGGRGDHPHRGDHPNRGGHLNRDEHRSEHHESGFGGESSYYEQSSSSRYESETNTSSRYKDSYQAQYQTSYQDQRQGRYGENIGAGDRIGERYGVEGIRAAEGRSSQQYSSRQDYEQPPQRYEDTSFQQQSQRYFGGDQQGYGQGPNSRFNDDNRYDSGRTSGYAPISYTSGRNEGYGSSSYEQQDTHGRGSSYGRQQESSYDDEQQSYGREDREDRASSDYDQGQQYGQEQRYGGDDESNSYGGNEYEERRY